MVLWHCKGSVPPAVTAALANLPQSSSSRGRSAADVHVDVDLQCDFDKIDGSALSPAEFATKFVLLRKPAVLTGLTTRWRIQQWVNELQASDQVRRAPQQGW